MGNILNTFKKFLANKNTVTILGVLVGVIVLWGFYSYRVNQATTPIEVPYAKEAINAADEIVESKIGTVKINRELLNNADIIQSRAELIGKYVTTGTSIPAGGLFYKTQVVDKAELPNSIFDDIPNGQTIYSLSVDNHTTYGNSIYPGDKIDLYLQAKDETDKIMFGKFIESITVLGVRDGSGNNVFDSAGDRTPAELLFAVKDEDYELLMKSGYVSGITLIPVPRNKNYTAQGREMKTTEYLKNYILAQTASIGE